MRCLVDRQANLTCLGFVFYLLKGGLGHYLFTSFSTSILCSRTSKLKKKGKKDLRLDLSLSLASSRLTSRSQTENKREEANHGLLSSPIPSLVSSSPFNKENRGTKHGRQEAASTGFLPSASRTSLLSRGLRHPSVLPGSHQGVKSIKRWQHGEHVPCYFNLCL